MSTVFAIFDRKKRELQNSSIQRMKDALSYWSADDEGIWTKGSVSLGHRMLWNTPQSKLEHLPLIKHPNDKILTITIDARLDNRETLAEQLEMTDLSLGKITDSDLVLSAYQKWGEECPKYLLGDFVFVIWDDNKGELFCARDHIGIKSFYYYLSDDLFVFSNDIHGVLAHPEVSEKYNDRSIAMCLAGDFGFYDEKDTFFEEIRKLPAATSITITNSNVSESVYWDIENIAQVTYDTYEEYVEKLRELLYDAVKVRLRTAYPVASHLSGGIDSSTITVLSARELEKRDQKLYAFNWVEAPDIEHDTDLPEWDYAAQLASQENIEQKNIRFTAEFIAEKYEKVDISKEDSSYFWEEYLVRDEAEKHKIRTFLSGWGGDELISYNGYTYLSGLLSQAQYIKAIQKIHNIYSFKAKKYKYLRMIKRFIWELLYTRCYKWMSPSYKEKKYWNDSSEFTPEPFSSFVRDIEFFLPEHSCHPGVHNAQRSLFTQGHILQRIENWASSATAKRLEYSYPLLDKRIVEFALSVPEDLFAMRDGHERYFFKSAISDFLPENIAWAVKIDEPLHSTRWAKLWDEALKLWMKENEYMTENKNCYIDRSKMMDQINIYFENKQNKTEDDIATNGIVEAILLSNLKDKGISSNRARETRKYE